MQIFKRRLWLLLLVALLGIGLFLPQQSTQAECQPLPVESIGVIKINVDAGQYRLWLRQISPTVDNTELVVRIDDQCPRPIAKSQVKDTLDWVGNDTQDQPLLFTLAAGEHTITIGGDKTGIDKGVLTNDITCMPKDMGENCPIQSSEPASPESGSFVIPVPRNLGPLLAAIAGIAIIALLGFLFYKYYGFTRRVVAPAATENAPTIHYIARLSTLNEFLRHHIRLIIISSVIMIALLAAVTFGIASASAAQENNGSFEMEAGALYGGAVVAHNESASGGSLVFFGLIQQSPAPQDSSKVPTPSNGGGNNGGDKPGDGDGPGDDPGGGTPTGECPAYPDFPDENCTGWEHTGVTLTNCMDRTDNGYIWEPNLTFDSCYFPQEIIVYGENTTITRSQVHGMVSTHWSLINDNRNLTLIDVEIEREGQADAYQGAVGGHNFTCLRCHVHHTGTGIHVGDNSVVQDSYIHDFNYTDGAHGAGIGMGQNRGYNSKVLHNNIQCNRLPGQIQICSSALSIYDEPKIDNVLVKNNLFNTTGGYCTYSGGVNGTNIRYIDNVFGKKFYSGCGEYGPVAYYYPPTDNLTCDEPRETSPKCNYGNEWRGNKWQDGSGAVGPTY